MLRVFGDPMMAHERPSLSSIIYDAIVTAQLIN